MLQPNRTGFVTWADPKDTTTAWGSGENYNVSRGCSLFSALTSEKP